MEATGDSSCYAGNRQLTGNAPSGLASLPDCFSGSLRDFGKTLGDFRPGNGIVAQALLSVSRRSASLHRPQGALSSSPPKPLAWDRSLPRPVGETGRRSVGNRKERPKGATMRVSRTQRPLRGSGSRSLPPAVRDEGRRSAGNRKECRSTMRVSRTRAPVGFGAKPQRSQIAKQSKPA